MPAVAERLDDAIASIVIRPVRADEWRRWRDVRVRMLREESRFFGTRWEDALAQPEESWSAWVADATGETKALFVAEEEDRWLGVVGSFLRVDPSEAQLISMWVDRDARRRGIAQELIRAVATWARARGCNTVCLFVQETNLAAQRLYEKAGFAPTGDREQLSRRRGFKLLFTAPIEDLLA